MTAELAVHADLAGRSARADDLGLEADHRFGTRLRAPAAGQPETPGELHDLNRDSADHHERIPGKRDEEREDDRDEQRHRRRD